MVPPGDGEREEEGEGHGPGEEGMVKANLHIYNFTSQMAKRTTWKGGKKVCFSFTFCLPTIA